MAMTRPRFLTLAGAMILAELGGVALSFDSDRSHGQDCCP